MDYGYIFRRAFEITWRFKFLWIFGILGGGSYGSSFGGGPNSSFDPSMFESGNRTRPRSSAGAESVEHFFNSIDPGIIIAVFLLLVPLFIALLVIGIIFRGALIGSIADIEAGRAAGLGAGWRRGVRCFWRLLGQGLLVFAVILAVAIPVIILVVALTAGVAIATLGIGLIILIPLLILGILLLIPIFIGLTIVLEYAQREIVIRDQRIIASLRTGYWLLRRNLGPSLLVWLITVGIGLGVGIVFLVGLLIAALPGIAVGLAAGLLPGIIVGVALGIPILVVLAGATGTLLSTLWNLGWEQVARRDWSRMNPQPVPTAST